MLGAYINPVIDLNLPDPGILALREGLEKSSIKDLKIVFSHPRWVRCRRHLRSRHWQPHWVRLPTPWIRRPCQLGAQGKKSGLLLPMEVLGLRNDNCKLAIANLEDKEVNIHALKLGLKLWSCQGWKWCVNDFSGPRCPKFGQHNELVASRESQDSNCMITNS